LLSSIPEDLGAHAIGIILSGYDGDGTAGCQHIKAKGGTTFAQDISAEVIDMPRSAQASGSVDFVLPPEKIPNELRRLVGASRKGSSTKGGIQKGASKRGHPKGGIQKGAVLTIDNRRRARFGSLDARAEIKDLNEWKGVLTIDNPLRGPADQPPTML
jgi:CheB methylesterase